MNEEQKIKRCLFNFWLKVEKTDYCWLWTGAVCGGGYGSFAYLGKNQKPHRISYELEFGAIPAGMVVRHFVCRNKLCVRPEHLRIGSDMDNVHDSIRDGTFQRAERNGNSYLKSDQIRAIRSDFKSGMSQMDLSIKYKTGRRNINFILNGKSWRGVGEETVIEGHRP